MLPTTPLAMTSGPAGAAASAAPTTQPAEMSEDAKLRFEQLLWAELLVHTGLEDALTLGGGQGASMFSRYFVEAIAADIAKQHPLGLLDSDLPTDAPTSTELKTGQIDNG